MNSLRSNIRARGRRVPALVLGAVGALTLIALAGSAVAQPSLTGISPTRSPANTGATVTIFGTGIGSGTDVARFPGPADVTPTAWGAGWITVRVPATWSGAVSVWNGSQWSSNTVDINISFNWSKNQWASASLSWVLNQNGAPGNTVNATRDALVGGYNAWSCASGLSVTYSGTTALQPNNQSDGINVQGWMNSGWSPSTIAVTNWRYTVSTGNMVEFDIAYNSQHFTWATNGAAGSMDIGDIGTHEEGHSIGLLDLYGDADNQETMYGYSSNGETQKRALAVDDVEGVEFIYSHAGRADLWGSAPAGWAYGVVPRAAADGAPGSVPMPTVLTGDATSYVSVNEHNMGSDCATPHSNNQLWVDDASLWDFWWDGILNPGADVSWYNLAATVRGGRHTLEARWDTNSEIVESNEFNNYRLQYVWSPYVLTNQVAIYQNRPPERGYLAIDNCDGYQFTGNWWGAVGVIPTTAGDDYDITLYNDYANASTGFSTPLAHSISAGQFTDFVVVNGNVTGIGNGATRQAGITRYIANSGGNSLVQQCNQVGSTLYPTTTYGTEVSTGSVAFGAADVLKVHEVYLGDTGTVYRITMDCQSGSADLDVGIYGAAYSGKDDYERASMTAGAGGDEFFTYQPTTAGYHGIVVFRRSGADIGASANYEVRVGRALANLSANTTPGGWASPVVPRATNDATGGSAPLPATLPGNANATYFNYATEQQGPGSTPGWGTRLYVDEEWYAAWSASPNPCDPGIWFAGNIGPFDIRGGRHSLTHYVDYDNVVAEATEGDNTWRGQWIWSPLETDRATPSVRSVPPTVGYFPNPNCDGARFVHTESYAWVAAIAPSTAGDDYDLCLYDDYANSTTGFSNLIGSSMYGGNATDFVVGHYAGTPLVVFPAAVRFSSGGGGNSYALDQNDATGRNGFATGSFLGQTLSANRLADVYEAYLVAGQTYRFLLTCTSQNTDLRLAIFPGTPGHVYGRGMAMANGAQIPPNKSIAVFTVIAPDETGFHPIVVYRDNGTASDARVTYDLVWGPPATTDVSDNPEPTPTVLGFRSVYPNPTVDHATLSFALPSQTHVALDVYDLRGRLVASLVDGDLPAGRHEVTWNSRDAAGKAVASGVYYARLRAQGKVLTQRVNVVR